MVRMAVSLVLVRVERPCRNHRALLLVGLHDAILRVAVSRVHVISAPRYVYGHGAL